MKKSKAFSFKSKFFIYTSVLGFIPLLLALFLSRISVDITVFIVLPSFLVILEAFLFTNCLGKSFSVINPDDLKREITKNNNLALELAGSKEIIECFRAKTHEFGNKLHVISGLLELGAYEDAKKYLLCASDKDRAIISLLNNIRVNAVSGLLIGKENLAEKKGVKLELDIESTLHYLPKNFEEDIVITVLGDLIDNALDAAASNIEDPYVSVLIKQKTSVIAIEVKDNGQGILENANDNIFEPGFTTKSNGTGYGLVNVKRMVHRAKGNLQFLTSEKGTAFYVTIPCASLSEREQGGPV